MVKKQESELQDTGESQQAVSQEDSVIFKLSCLTVLLSLPHDAISKHISALAN